MQTNNGRHALYMGAMGIVSRTFESLGFTFCARMRPQSLSIEDVQLEMYTILKVLERVPVTEADYPPTNAEVQNALDRVLFTDPAELALCFIQRALQTMDDAQAVTELQEALRWARRAADEREAGFRPFLFPY